MLGVDIATLTSTEIQEIHEAATAQGYKPNDVENYEDYTQRILAAFAAGDINIILNEHDNDEDDEDDDDALDDAFSELRRILPRRRLSPGEYSCAVVDVKYTELPASDPTPSYVTLNLVVSKGRYKGKRIPLRINAS